ncbi:MAG: metal-binding protein [Eubacteriaceae bacterium]|nr:metal-binding protein [Eubacteriaceae bacterium]
MSQNKYTLLNADNKFYQSDQKGKFGGYRKTKIYGKLDCIKANKYLSKGLYVKNRVFFADEQTAVAAGYRPCAVCMPKEYQVWKANKGK